MDLFGRNVISKAQLQRAALTFGQASHIRDPASRKEIIADEIKRYEGSSGGYWNYDDLFQGLREVAGGAPYAMLRKRLEGLTGEGEAGSKVGLADKIFHETPLIGGDRLRTAPRETEIGDGVFLEITFDLIVKKNNQVFCYFIYPGSKPMKVTARSALMDEFSMPFSGMDCPHNLIFVENPRLQQKRHPKIYTQEFKYRKRHQNFIDHLKLSYQMMNAPD